MQRAEKLTHLASAGFAIIATPVGAVVGMFPLDLSAVGNGLLWALYTLCLYLGVFAVLFAAHEVWQSVMHLAFREYE